MLTPLLTIAAILAAAAGYRASTGDLPPTMPDPLAYKPPPPGTPPASSSTPAKPSGGATKPASSSTPAKPSGGATKPASSSTPAKPSGGATKPASSSTPAKPSGGATKPAKPSGGATKAKKPDEAKKTPEEEDDEAAQANYQEHLAAALRKKNEEENARNAVQAASFADAPAIQAEIEQRDRAAATDRAIDEMLEADKKARDDAEAQAMQAAAMSPMMGAWPPSPWKSSVGAVQDPNDHLRRVLGVAARGLKSALQAVEEGQHTLDAGASPPAPSSHRRPRPPPAPPAPPAPPPGGGSDTLQAVASVAATAKPLITSLVNAIG